MIAEIVSNGMLSLPNAMAAVGKLPLFLRPLLRTQTGTSSGIVPALILTIFLGVFGLFTAKLLIDFKLNHPSVHSMGMHMVLFRHPFRSFLTSCRGCRVHTLWSGWTGSPCTRYGYFCYLWNCKYPNCRLADLMKSLTFDSGFRTSFWTAGSFDSFGQWPLCYVAPAHILHCYATFGSPSYPRKTELARPDQRGIYHIMWYTSYGWCRSKPCA